jgi:hypothetical protein
MPWVGVVTCLVRATSVGTGVGPVSNSERPGRGRAEPMSDSSGGDDVTFLSTGEDGGDAPFERPHADQNRQ